MSLSVGDTVPEKFTGTVVANACAGWPTCQQVAKTAVRQAVLIPFRSLLRNLLTFTIHTYKSDK